MLPATRLSFYLLESPAIRERETTVARLSGELGGRLPPATRAALAQCLEGINSYYSNLIEGQGTRPIDAERALQRNLLEHPRAYAGGRAADLALLAVAHIQTERWMRQLLKNDPAVEVADAGFIRELHRRFVSQLPDSLRIAAGRDGETALNLPGALRARQVNVGAHVTPAPEELPGLFPQLFEIDDPQAAMRETLQDS